MKNLKFPPQFRNNNCTQRINQMDSGYDQQYQDFYGYNNGERGRGRGGRGRSRRRGGQGRGYNFCNTRTVQLTDGTEIEVHPAFHFSQEVWNLLPQQERDRLRNKRNAHRGRRLNDGGYATNDGRSTISEITMQNGTQQPNKAITKDDSSSHRGGNVSCNVWEISTGRSIMGGHNEQASLCSRNTNDRN